LVASTIGTTGFLAARYTFPGQVIVLAGIILLTAVLFFFTVWHGAVAVFSSRFAGRPTLLDRASAEPVAALFLLPVTTALTGLAINFAGGGADLLNDWAPEARVSTNLLAFEVVVVAVVLSVLVPLIALGRVVQAKQGRGVGLFDPEIDDAAFQSALDERWSRLRTAPRRWVATHRVAAIGDETAPADVAWPTRPDRMPPAYRRSLTGAPWVAAVAAVASLLVAAAAVASPSDHLPDLNLTILAIACGVAPASLTVLLIWIHIYRRLLREQGEADLLRLAKRSRPAPPPPPPLTLAERLGLLRQAFGRQHSPAHADESGRQPGPSAGHWKIAPILTKHRETTGPGRTDAR